MSRIEKLRERSRISQELYEKKLQRACDAVSDYMSSDAAKLTIANHMNSEDDLDMHKFAETVATKVTDVVLDPVADFDDVCRHRQFSDDDIHHIVESFSDIFNLGVGESYEVKKRAVARYLQANPRLYEDMCNFK